MLAAYYHMLEGLLLLATSDFSLLLSFPDSESDSIQTKQLQRTATLAKLDELRF